MVTGVETAGLVLAAFPLIIQGLNQYVQGIETIRYWRRFRRELAMYAQTTENEYLWYLDTLEELLGEIAPSDDDIALLLSEPGGALWHTPEIEGKLRTRLYRSYNSYFRTMASMVKALETLGEKLGIDIRGKVRHYFRSEGSRI